MVLAPSFSRPSIKRSTTPQLSHFASTSTVHENIIPNTVSLPYDTSPSYLFRCSPNPAFLHFFPPPPSPQVFQSCSISATWTRTHRPWQQSIIWIPDPQGHRKTRDKVSDILLLPISLSRSTQVLAQRLWEKSMEMPTNKQTKEQEKRAKDVRACKTTKPQLLPSNKNPEEEKARTWRKFVEEDTHTEKSRGGISMHWKYRPEL